MYSTVATLSPPSGTDLQLHQTTFETKPRERTYSYSVWQQPSCLEKVPFVDPDYTGDSNDGGANDPTARYIGMGVNIKF